jgi:aspartyl protease family protein
MINWALRMVMIWGGIALAIYVVVSSQLGNFATPSTPAAAIATPAVPSAPATSSNSMVFRADNRGHVTLDGYVNAAAVRFIVDTGATLVALTVDDALRAGFSHSDLVFNEHASTANGMVRVASVRLREIRIGQFSTSDVPAVVIENLSISLLGQSFLQRLGGYEMRGGVLTMNSY